MEKVLETNRLILRTFTPNDIEVLFELFSDSEVMKHLPGIKSREEIEEWIRLVLKSYRDKGFGPWALICKESKQLLGYCGLYIQQNVDGKNEIEILYGLIRRYWNKGYATEAARAVYEYGKNQLKLNRFISLIARDNLRSVNVAEKIGMKLEKEIHMWGKQYLLFSKS